MSRREILFFDSPSRVQKLIFRLFNCLSFVPHYFQRANIDVAKGKMTVLSPSVGRLPSKTALLGVSFDLEKSLFTRSVFSESSLTLGFYFLEFLLITAVSVFIFLNFNRFWTGRILELMYDFHTGIVISSF